MSTTCDTSTCEVLDAINQMHYNIKLIIITKTKYTEVRRTIVKNLNYITPRPLELFIESSGPVLKGWSLTIIQSRGFT